MISAGDQFRVELNGCRYWCQVLSSSFPGSDKVVFVVDGDLDQPYAEPAGDVEKIIGANGFPKAGPYGPRLATDELQNFQDAALKSGMPDYHKNLIRGYLASRNQHSVGQRRR